MHLIAVTAGRCRAVVADGDREEVEHEIGIADTLVAPGEPATLEMVRRPGTAAEKEPLEAYPRPLAPLERRCDGDGPRARVLDVDLEMVLEVLAHPHEVLHDVPPRALSSAAFPMPESCRSWGELKAPPHKMTSPARIRRPPGSPSSTPTALRPSNRTLVTNRPQSTSRLGLYITGCRYAARRLSDGHGGCSGRKGRSPPVGNRSRRRSAGSRPAAQLRRRP